MQPPSAHSILNPMKRRRTAWVGAEISQHIRDLMDEKRDTQGVTVRWVLERAICLYLGASDEDISAAYVHKRMERHK